jgi:serine protease
VVVVAAGNSAGEPVDNPGNCPGALAVTGLRHIGTKVGFSSMGPEVAIGAPGGNCVNLPQAPASTPCCPPPTAAARVPALDTYTDTAAAVGTSFATPLVAGTAALMLSRNPSLSADDVRRILRETARPFPSQGAEAAVGSCSEPVTVDTGECYCTQSTCGAGMLDTSAAVLAAAAKGGPPVVSVSGAPTSVTVGNSVNAHWHRQRECRQNDSNLCLDHHVGHQPGHIQRSDEHKYSHAADEWSGKRHGPADGDGRHGCQPKREPHPRGDGCPAAARQ